MKKGVKLNLEGVFWIAKKTFSLLYRKKNFGKKFKGNIFKECSPTAGIELTSSSMMHSKEALLCISKQKLKSFPIIFIGFDEGISFEGPPKAKNMHINKFYVPLSGHNNSSFKM